MRCTASQMQALELLQTAHHHAFNEVSQVVGIPAAAVGVFGVGFGHQVVHDVAPDAKAAGAHPASSGFNLIGR